MDGRSDLFSVGCMLYELLAGRRPFHAGQPHGDLLQDHPRGAGLRRCSRRAATWRACCPSCSKSLAKELDERYQTAREFAADLREYLRTHASSTSAARALENLLDDGAPADAILGATVVEADPTPATYRPAATAPAPSGVQPTLLDRASRRP